MEKKFNKPTVDGDKLEWRNEEGWRSYSECPKCNSSHIDENLEYIEFMDGALFIGFTCESCGAKGRHYFHDLEDAYEGSYVEEYK